MQEWIVITGGTRGIGWGFAQASAERGHKILLVGRSAVSESQKQELKESGASEVKAWQFDLSKQEAVAQFIDELKRIKVSLFFNNAGLLLGGPIETQDFSAIYQQTNVNLTVPIQLTSALLPQMLERNEGVIINNASVTGIMSFPAASSYAGTKAGLIGFSRAVQAELRNTSVQLLLLITPGIKTEMFDEIDSKIKDHLKVPTTSIPVNEYAQRIWSAVDNKQSELRPPGAMGFYVNFAQTFPGTFKNYISRTFQR